MVTQRWRFARLHPRYPDCRLPSSHLRGDSEDNDLGRQSRNLALGTPRPTNGGDQMTASHRPGRCSAAPLPDFVPRRMIDTLRSGRMGGADNIMGTVRRAMLTALLVVLVAFAPPAAGEQSRTGSAASNVTGGLLPLNFVVTLRLVNQFLPEIVQLASTGKNSTAVGNPQATRAVIYANDDKIKLVTITVDRYGSASDAAAAYQEALAKSKAAPGFGPISIQLNVGEQAFAGTSSQGDETHLGLGALDGELIVGATLASFDATPDNLINLIGLARAEDAAANAAADR